MENSEEASKRHTTFCFGATGTIESVICDDGTILTGKQVLEKYPWVGSGTSTRPAGPYRLEANEGKATEEPQDPL